MALTVADGFPYYISLTQEDDLPSLFKKKEILSTLSTLTEEKSQYRYAPGKWSLKQMLGHITDHERIMTYRALRFSRRDDTLLPGYDQDPYVENSRFDELPWEDLLQDHSNVREATISFIKSLSEEQLQLKGKAWKYELTVEDFLRAIVGHERHHLIVIKSKYL